MPSASRWCWTSFDGKRLALKQAIQNDRLQIAKENLADIYEIESALRDHIGELETSEWGLKLESLMAQVATDLDAEFHRLPEGTRHILGSLKRHQEAGFTSLMRQGRDALARSAGYCRNLVRP
jgi:hypothetical protein